MYQDKIFDQALNIIINHYRNFNITFKIEGHLTDFPFQKNKHLFIIQDKFLE